MKPQACKDGIVVKELSDELLVYDTDTHRAHCLNPTAALVWKHCDGKRTVKEIAGVLRAQWNVSATEEVVWMALDRLGKAHLLKERMSPPPEVARYSRRELVRKLGLVGGLSVLVPLVSSVVAPTPAEAAVTCVLNCAGQPNFTPCGSPCTGLCMEGSCVG